MRIRVGEKTAKGKKIIKKFFFKRRKKRKELR
jgi:hypothetical protein